MRIAIAVGFTVFVLSMIHIAIAEPNATCYPGEIIEVKVDLDVNPELENFYATVLNTKDCNSAAAAAARLTTIPGTNIQTTNITCFNLTAEVPFTIALVENATIHTEASGAVTFGFTCHIPENAEYVSNVDISVSPATATVTGIYDAVYTLTFSPTNAALGQALVAVIELDAASRLDATIGLLRVTYQIVGTSFIADLLTDGCPNTTRVTEQAIEGVPNGEAPYKITYKFAATIINVGSNPSSIEVEVGFQFGICPKQDSGACYVQGGCDGGSSDAIGRKRRQDSDEEDMIMTETKRRFTLFTSKEALAEDVRRRMERDGVPIKPIVKKGEVCVNKTVTSILLTLLLIAMAICLISSAIMLVMLSKTRKDKLIKSDHSYSFKGF